jgi:hypothetical protein
LVGWLPVWKEEIENCQKMWTVVVVVVVVVLAEKNQHVTRQHFQHGQFH